MTLIPMHSLYCTGQHCEWSSHCARAKTAPSQRTHTLVPSVEATAERCDLYQKNFQPWGEGCDHA